MKRFLSTVVLIFGFACSTSATELSPTQSSIALAFDSTNQKILGDALGFYKDDLSHFTLEQYKDYLYKLTSQQPTKIKEALDDKFDIQEFQPYRETFVFCVFSSKEKFGMCDDPQCAGVEEKSVGINREDVNTWKDKLPMERCSKK